MNKTYRSVWSDALGAWVAVSELAPSRGKRSGSVVASVALLLFAGAPAWAQTITSWGDVTSSFAQTASPWNAGGSLDIGNAAAGGLALAGGAQVSSTQLHLGNSVGVAGALTVDGAGSTLNVAGQFDVGAVGTGTLSITNGGTVVNTGKAGIYYYFGVGYGSGTGNGSATGNVTISGTGSKLSTQYSSYIGGNDSAGGTGSGTVTVSHGGTFTTPTSFIGFDVFGNGGSGTVNVMDAGSSWVNSGVSRIGYGSGATEHGTVNVGNGATATIGNFAIVGLGTGGAGIVNVSGNGSTWNVANTANTNGVGLAIGLGANTGTGANATGAVTIADGAVVNTPVVRLGTDAGASASGTLNIGAAAGLAAAAPGTLNAPTVVFNWLSPGNSNGSPTTGTLNFNHTSTDGSYVFAPNIGSGGGTGSATINQLAGHTTLTGNSGGYGGFTQVSGGVLGVTGTLGNGTGDVAVSQGAFNVEGGGTVNARTATYGDTVGGIATGSVSGAGSSLNVAGQFDVGAVGTGTLSITNGGTVVNTGSTGGGAFFGVGHGSGTGNVTISGAGSALSNLSASYIGGTDSAGGTGSGTVTVSHGGTFTTPTSFIGFDVFGNGGSGTVNVTDAGSSWVNTGVSRIGYGSGATEHGTVNVGNGATATIGNFAIVGLGTGGAGIVNVSGNGSTWNVANTANTNGVGLAIGLGANTGTGANATGAVTIADGAVVNTPVVRLGTDAGASASGTLNIGAAAGLAAAAPGTLNAPTVVFNWLSPGNSNGSPTTGTLNFNHTSTDGSYVFAPNIGSGGGTGSATINQLAGHTTLTGNSGSFGGTTNVTGGTLRVNGTLGNATSQVNVGNGAALGGAGTIGGNVAIGDGVLSPGNSPGTLTINGNLALSSASTLNYELGAANTVGGPLNDLTVVNGNLTLDGTLNVTQSAGGTYGAGVYRLIDYAGTLTDNGLALGSMPAGTDNYVQTSIAKQVNLVNSRGLTLNWWDGSAGGRNDGAIAGGNGTWTAIGSGATADRWTQADGQINAPYQNGSFAIFAGGPGTVTVDNSAGQVRVSGMQFATSGYRIEGGPVELAAGTNAIRVGDGTSAGAAATATIASALTGAGKLDKVDLGTLVLTGANTYTGGTTVSGGTLQLGDGGTSGAITGDVTNNATLAFNRSDATTFAGTISGSGRLVQAGSGSTTLTGTNTYSGGTLINAGTLVGSATSFGSGAITDNAALVVAQASDATMANAVHGSGSLTKTGSGTLVLTGASTYTGGTVINAGTLQLGDGGTSGAIAGDVTNNATLAFNRSDATTFAGTISGSGRLVQAGSGSTTLSGTNTYSGGTTVSAGTLQLGDGGASGAITGDVTNNATLAFNRSDATTFAGTISGSGRLVQAGSGSTTLSGANTYSGGTLINAGTLSGSASSFGSGAITDNAALVVAQGSDATMANAIHGSGSLTKTGSGTLVLTAANTYSGGTLIDAGTLVGSASSFGSGAITDNAALVIAQDSDGTMANAIHGSGSLTKTGSGTLVLSGANTYSGGTLIDAGTLIGSASSFGSGAITDNAALVIAQGSDATMANAIHGSGSLTKTGSGTLVLTAASTYTGGTVINAGTLQLGDGGTSGAITGDVTNNATLAFNRSDATTFAGTISGSGRLVQAGSGSTTLSGTNTYSGGTLIDAGTLIGSASSFGSGAITDNAALVIAQASDATMANAVHGSGSLTKTGPGTLDYVGNGSLNGPTMVAQGTLAVNGSLGNSAVTVAGGATLAGNGTVGTTTVAAGGTVSPGNGGIGTLTVNGHFTQAAGSMYQVQVAPGTQASDRIDVLGSADVSGGTLAVARTSAGRYALDTKYAVLHATGGVNGTYGQVIGDTRTAFVQLKDSYDANHVYLTAELYRSFASAGGTRDQMATGLALDHLSPDSALANALAWLPNDAAARAAFDQLSGDIHASVKSATVEDSRFVREAALLRLRAADCAPGAGALPARSSTQHAGTDADGATCTPAGNERVVWGQSFGSWGRMAGDGNPQRIDRDIGGFFVGADTALAGGWRAGALGGYSRSTMDSHGRGNAKTDSYHLGLYGGNTWGATSLRLGAAHAWNKLDTHRSVFFSGYGDAASAKYDSRTAQLFGEVGHRIDLGGTAVEPFAQLAHVRLSGDGFNERGGLAALHGGGDGFSSTFATLGVRSTAQLGSRTRLTGMLGWRHAFGDTVPASTHAFAGSLASFTVGGVPLARNVAVLEAGVEAELAPKLTLGASYAGQFGNGLRDHGFKLNLAYRF